MRSTILALILIPNLAFAGCNWATDVKKHQGKYVYSKDCHIAVGKIKKENELRKEQITELKNTIKLKDLAYNAQLDRVALWQETSYNLEDRLLKVDRWKRLNDWAMFGLGVLVMSAATYGASKIKD